MGPNKRLRAVWSLWTKPMQAHRGFAWASDKHHLFGWVLSIQRARRHYPETCLYTDDAGARLLIDRMNLEFDHVSTALNALDKHDPDWWALGKLYTYRLQTEPFVHLDCDVFLWKPLPSRLESAPLIGQNPESGAYYQPERLEHALRDSDGWLPAEWHWYRSAYRTQHGICCGIFGGQRVDFIRYYAGLAVRLLEHPVNQRCWALLDDKRRHNVLPEQYLLMACIAYHRNRQDSPYHSINIQYLFNSTTEAFNPENAADAGYTHLLGNAKNNPALARRLENRVRRDYPDHYGRCLHYGQRAVLAETR